MRTSHRLLLRLYHDPRFRFEEVTICYVDRGAPHDRTCVTGDRILHLDSFYMEISSPVGGTAIPYHRIRQIRYQDQVLWDWVSTSSDRDQKKDSR